MKVINVSGKRKNAIARARLREGSGKIRINEKPVDLVEPIVARMRLKEPVILAGNDADKVDIDVNVAGGGFMGQSEAARLTIAKALVQYDKKL